MSSRQEYIGQRTTSRWFSILACGWLGLLWGGHGLLCLHLFGSAPWSNLTSDEPIVAGRHPLNLYHGIVGASTLFMQKSTLVHDPAFQAGYTKNPWLDQESKPMEWVMALAGRERAPQAYKITVLLLWWLLPGASFLAALLLGQGWSLRLWSFALTLILFWSDFGQEQLWQGDVATLGAAGGMVVWNAALTRLFTQPCWLTWLFWVLIQAALFHLQPLVLVLLLPTLLIFYLRIGWRRTWGWHCALGAGLFLSVLLNYPWFRDAVRSAWMLSDKPLEMGQPAAIVLMDWPIRILSLGWLNLGLLLLLLAGGNVGMAMMRRRLPSGSTRSLLALWLILLVLSWLGPLWPTLERLEPARWFFAALFLSVLPCAWMLRGVPGLAWRWGRRFPVAGIMLSTFFAVGAGVYAWSMWAQGSRWTVDIPALPLGWPKEASSWLETIRSHTDGASRILWEEDETLEPWTPLLGLTKDRYWMGGLYPRVVVEHLQLKLAEGQLAGKPLSDWTLPEWEQWITRYNIGAIVVRSPITLSIIRSMARIRAEKPLPPGRTLLLLDRQPSYFLKGSGRVIVADAQKLTLADLEPEDNEIILSFHYLADPRSTNARVRVERCWLSGDNLPLIRLRMVGPMTRLTLYWQE